MNCTVQFAEDFQVTEIKIQQWSVKAWKKGLNITWTELSIAV